jgi:hypothetical protein
MPIDLLTFNLDLHEDAGYVIESSIPNYISEYTVTGADDVNGDGIPDIAIGIGPPLKRAFVVFGKPSPAPVQTWDLGEHGFRIRNATSHIGGGGDVNGDGLADVVFDNGVVFGKKSVLPDDLERLRHGRGFEVRSGIHLDDNPSLAWPSVDVIEDINGDGLDEVVTGRADASFGGKEGSGSVFIIYGKRSSRPLHLARLGRRGYRIDGSKERFFFGSRVAAVGDVDGDGISEIIAGAPGLGPDGRRAFVVFLDQEASTRS